MAITQAFVAGIRFTIYLFFLLIVWFGEAKILWINKKYVAKETDTRVKLALSFIIAIGLYFTLKSLQS